MTTLAHNAVAMLVARVLPPLLGFLISVGIARLLGAGGLGLYASLVAMLAVFQAVAGAGMSFLLTREIAGQPDQARFHLLRARSFAIVSGLAATASYLIYVVLVLPEDELWSGVILAVTLLPSALIAVQESVFMALRAHHYVAVVAVIENCVKLVVALAALAAGGQIAMVCLGIVVGRLAGLAIGARCIRRLGLGGVWVFDSAEVVPFARAILPFASLFVLSMFYFRVDVPIVLSVAGREAAGHYSAASTLFSALLLLPDAGLAAVYPRLVTAFKSSRDGYAKATWVVVKFLTIVLTSVSLVLMALAGPAIGVLFGPDFGPSVEALRLLALCLPIQAVNGALGQALQAGGAQRALMFVVVAAVVFHVVLNIIFVHALGVIGAPLAMLCSGSMVAIGALWLIHRCVMRLRITWRIVFGVVPFAGPLLLALLAPVAVRPYASVVGLLWLAFGSVWQRTLVRGEWVSVFGALRSRSHGIGV